MRLIDGDALVDILTKAIENVKSMARIFNVEDEEYVQDIVKAYTEFVDCIKDMPTEHQWIPVSERLPEEGQGCLVCDKGSILIDTFTGRGNPYNWKWYVRDYEAWMPLLEPYREEGEK